MKKQILTFTFGFGLASVIWFHISTMEAYYQTKEMFARIDHMPSFLTPKAEEVQAAEIVPVTPSWVTDSQKLIEEWSKVKLKPNEPEYITKKRVVDALVTFYGESGWDKGNSNSKGNKPEGSIDRGFYMFNSYWRKDVSDKCAYDFDCATEEAIKTYKARKDFSAWHAAKAAGIK